MSQGKILLVDDSPSVRLMLEDQLKADGYTVCSAENGQLALELLDDLIPDLVITDVSMPGMDGFDLCRRTSFGGCHHCYIWRDRLQDPFHRRRDLNSLLIHLSTSHSNAGKGRPAIRAASVPNTIGDPEAITPDQSTTAPWANRVLAAIVRHIADVDIFEPCL